jgi:hypothetical protein
MLFCTVAAPSAWSFTATANGQRAMRRTSPPRSRSQVRHRHLPFLLFSIASSLPLFMLVVGMVVAETFAEYRLVPDSEIAVRSASTVAHDPTGHAVAPMIRTRKPAPAPSILHRPLRTIACSDLSSERNQCRAAPFGGCRVGSFPPFF